MKIANRTGLSENENCVEGGGTKSDRGRSVKTTDRIELTGDGDRVESGGAILLKEQCSVIGSETRRAG